MPARFTVSDEVREVLARATIEERRVVLPEQLDRKLYLAVAKVLAAAGGRWDRKASAHVFERDPRAALGLAVEEGVAVDRKAELGAYYTPAALARLVVKLAEVPSSGECLLLEPSVGAGALALAAWEANPRCRIHGYDVDADALLALDSQVRHRPRMLEARDFLEVEPSPTYDRVLMNPPFGKRADARHVLHASRFLRPGGILVAIVAAGTIEARGKGLSDLVKLVGESEVFDVPAGAFRESGTEVRTKMLKHRRPRGAEPAGRS